MIQPTVYGQAIIILVYVPLLTFSGVEGKMFEPMAMTVIIALAAAFVLSLTFVPALIAIAGDRTVCRRERTVFVRGLKRIYAPGLARAIRARFPVIGAGAGSVLAPRCFCSRGSARSSSRRWMKRTSRCMPCGFPARR